MRELIDDTSDPILLPEVMLLDEARKKLDQLLERVRPQDMLADEVAYEIEDVVRVLGMSPEELIKKLDAALAKVENDNE